MNMHNARARMSDKCPVCASPAWKPCVQATPKKPKATVHPIDKDALAWAEFAFFAACHNLKELKPDHLMVRTVEAALKGSDCNPNQLELFPFQE